jgi:hypothetical protein
MKARGIFRSTTLTIIVVSMLFVVSSCFDKNFDYKNISNEIELKPGISAPLAYGTLSLKDIITKIDTGNFVRTADDSLLYILYEKNLVSYKASDVVAIPDQDFLQFFIDSDVATLSLLPVAVGDTAKYTKDKNGEFVFSKGEKIDSMNLKTVRLHIDVTSSFHHKGILTIYSNNVFVDGKPFRRKVQISSVTGDFAYTLDSTLTNVKLVLNNTNPDTTVLPIKYDLALINSGALVNSGEKCDITMSFNQNKFSSVFGYLGEYDILVNSGQIDVSLFNERLNGGNLFFADPRLALTVNNSYGIPVQIELTNIEVVSTINSSTTPITFNGVNPFDIDAPDTSIIGESVHSDIPINKDNSNIDKAMETSPNHLNYTATAKTNAQGPTGPYNFVTDSSTMDLGVQVILPLWVKAEGFALEDTTDFDFEKEIGKDIDKIEYFRLTMNTDNGLPVETKVQVYFTDASYVVLDSMFRDDDVLLEPATVVNEKVTAPKNLIKQVEYTPADLEKIKPTKFIRYRASINTPTTGTGYFKFYSDYTVGIKLSVKANVRINSTEL